jgi:hypothetical protein
MKGSSDPEMHRHPLCAPSGLAARAETAQPVCTTHYTDPWGWKVGDYGGWQRLPLCVCACMFAPPHAGASLHVGDLQLTNFVGFEVLTAVVMNNTVFWDVTPCSPLKVNRRFGGTYRLLLQGRISRARYQLESRRQAEWLSTDYTELYPRR